MSTGSVFPFKGARIKREFPSGMSKTSDPFFLAFRLIFLIIFETSSGLTAFTSTLSITEDLLLLFVLSTSQDESEEIERFFSVQIERFVFTGGVILNFLLKS